MLATAAEATSPIKYKAAIGYDFEKVSHPTVGTSQPDGIVGYLGNGAVSCRVWAFHNAPKPPPWSLSPVVFAPAAYLPAYVCVLSRTP